MMYMLCTMEVTAHGRLRPKSMYRQLLRGATVHSSARRFRRLAMISTAALDELKQVHRNHVANTFLFASKLLDQRRRISDAQVEVIHGLLHDLAAIVDDAHQARDPAAIAQNAMRHISEGLASQSERSGDFFRETAASYAEILRLAVDYSADTFAGMQAAGRHAGRTGGSTIAVGNPWMTSFISSFESAADLMNSSIKPMMEAAGTPAGAVVGNGKAATAARTRR